MSGFIRANSNQSSQLDHSSGIPSLDELIKTGPQIITGIYEDENALVHNTMLQIVSSQLLSQDAQNTFVFGTEAKVLCRFKEKERADDDEKSDLKILIAWRYKELNNREKKFKYDLTKKEPICHDNTVTDMNILLKLIQETTEKNFVIFSLFSPLCGKFNSDEMIRILFDIRKYVKINKHTCFVSIPTYFHDVNFTQFMDNAIQINAIITPPLVTSLYAAILEVKKFASVGSLRVNTLISNKYGLRIKSKNFVVEKIDLPPEEIGSSTGCGTSF